MSNEYFADTDSEIQRPIKIGYARMVYPGVGECRYVSFKEITTYWKEDAFDRLRADIESGICELYCACSSADDLELSLTANNVIRVKHNMQQEKHKDSCPKSIKYASWVAENSVGTTVDTTDENKVVFRMTLPGTGAGGSSGSSPSHTEEGSKKSEGSQPRIDTYLMVKNLNSRAWEKQTFSRKKELAAARREGREPELSYKDLWKFSQLVYGISNDIYIQARTNIKLLADMYYTREKFYECADFRERFFVYAQIIKITEYKASRKYQYITIKLPSRDTSVTTVRVRTDIFQKMVDISDIGAYKVRPTMLAGWVNHSVYPTEGGGFSEWMTLLKGVVFYVSTHGLFADSLYEASVIDALCKEPIIFKKPYEPMENYRSICPSLLIEAKNRKNVILDIVSTDKEYEKRSVWCADNDEYECILVKEGEDIENIIDAVRSYVFD